MRFSRKKSAEIPETPEPRKVPIKEDTIRLGQFLKLANLIDSGSEAKPLVQAGDVLVNGEVDTRRGRQLVPGDRVTLRGETVEVAAHVEGEPVDDLPW